MFCGEYLGNDIAMFGDICYYIYGVRHKVSGGLLQRPDSSDYIETRKRESGMKGDELLSVPIEAVMGMMVGFIEIIVLLLIELINAKK